MNGPDFANLGKPVEWGDAAPIDERLAGAVEVARLNVGIDIELCRWSPDDPLADRFVSWWNHQRAAIRRHLTSTALDANSRLVVSRRTDRSDGIVKCYLRVDRKRPRLVAAS